VFGLLFLDGAIFFKYNYKLELGAYYLGAIAIAGDFLEIYYGFIKNLQYLIQKKILTLSQSK
jgi:hypothetical protein